MSEPAVFQAPKNRAPNATRHWIGGWPPRCHRGDLSVHEWSRFVAAQTHEASPMAAGCDARASVPLCAFWHAWFDLAVPTPISLAVSPTRVLYGF